MSASPRDTEGESIINDAFRRSSAVVAMMVVIGAGVYFIARMPRTQTIDATPAPGPIDTETPRVAIAAQLPQIPLRDVAVESGLMFSRDNGARGGKLLPETMGGGVGVLDVDNDGDQDIILIDGPSTANASLRLFRNDTSLAPAHMGKASPMSFTEVKECGLACNLDGMGLAIGDSNGDGRTDVLVTGVGETRLFRNDSTEQTIQFQDVTTESGVNPPSAQMRWGTSAGFFDPDFDGDLDLLVCNYVQWSPQIDRDVSYTLAGIGRAYGPPYGFAGDDLLFLRNRGDGTFSDETRVAGFQVHGSDGRAVGKALGLVFVDPDNDGDLDVVIANDTVAKGFFVNDGTGHFENRAAESGIAFDQNGAPTGAMGIDAAFLRGLHTGGENDLAIAIGNFANEPDSLYVSRGESNHFADDAIVWGLAAPTRSVLTFGLVFADMDLDGDQDIVQANGHIESEINRVQPSQTYAQRGQLFINRGTESPRFIELPSSSVGDLATPRIGRGLTYADFDGDGDLDLVLAQSHGPVALLRNDQTTGNHWLRITLQGKSPNTSAIGAEIELVSGGVTTRRMVSATRSYLSQSDLSVTFGLGTATKVDRIQIRWPHGRIQVLDAPQIDQTISVSE
ncbi:MAG: CRTAC1 family protein [Phycisphaerales bacterium]|nr:CRTAC1 family protein [Phycisphaerales bacterium]